MMALHAALLLLQSQPLLHQPDTTSLHDPMRPVCELGRDYFVLQYSTSTPTETIVQVREGNLLAFNMPQDPWTNSREYKLSGTTNFHKIKIDGLKPGMRYFYRVYDPGANPTSLERSWGSNPPWRREYAVATLAPVGRKTIVRIPVKVLLMLNVVNVDSAHGDSGLIAELPERMTESEVEFMKSEMEKAALFFWVNSGMRLWIDFKFFIDDRWQRWGNQPPNPHPFFNNWPVSRGYAGVDFAAPGGGAFNIIDTNDPLRDNKDPVQEETPYAGQIEITFVRRWDTAAKKWTYYNSGGGTFGIDNFPKGFPGRSQYLGGGDVAWLTCHEFHHQLESYSAFALSFREDDRIVFNHYEPRRRVARPDGGFDETTWTTSGRHGEHWDGMAFWDRTLTDIQWLRMCFGEAITVLDADGDGFPDDDPRLPLDEKRFGSDPKNPKTDGLMIDLHKVMLSTWTPNPLQSSWIKPDPQYFKFDPQKKDSDGDGLDDLVDPYPLFPYSPLIVSMTPKFDGKDDEWSHVPFAGTVNLGGIEVQFKQAHDENAWYGMLRLSGNWRNVDLVLDGEGYGLFSRNGVIGLRINKTANGAEVVKLWDELKGVTWVASREGDITIVEIGISNRGDSIWFWNRGGREIGTQLNVYDPEGRGYAMYETYRFFYARMIGPYGKPPLPTNAPSELTAVEANVLLPGDNRIKIEGAGWRTTPIAWIHEGGSEASLYIDGLNAIEFDIWIEIEARQDGILGAFVPTTRGMSAGKDYIVFVGGYGNTVTRFRLFGSEQSDAETMIKPGERMRLQFSRRSGGVWLIVDGKPTMFAADPNPDAVIDRLAVIGGYNGNQRVYEIRYRVDRQR